MKRQLAIILMVMMVIAIMSTLVSCGDECAHKLIKVDAAESTCTTEGNDEYYECTECGAKFSDAAATNPISAPATHDKVAHLDADKNHKCDSCNSAMGEHSASSGKHNCDYCGKPTTECVDVDANHKCDTCNGTVGTHAAANGSHYCDYCGEQASECADSDNNHDCDVCGKALSECADNDTNHACDLCGAEMGEHVANDGGHNCDYCGGPVTECVDENMDHVCDIGGCTVGEHVEGWGHMCEYCWQDVSGCYDNDKNHECDICFNKMGVHKPPVFGHACEYCGYKYSECVAGEDDGNCATPVYCTKCPEIVIPAISHDYKWHSDDNGHYGECMNEGCDYESAKAAHSTGVCTCECGYVFTPKCDACGNCLDPECSACETKCVFIDTSKIIHFVPNANMAAPEGPGGLAPGAAGAYVYDTTITSKQIVLDDGTKALLVTAPNGAAAHSGVSFKNNDANTINSYGQAGYNCGNPTLTEGHPVRMHFTNHGNTTITFKYSDIDYYYDKGAVTLTLAPGETKSALMYVYFGKDSIGLNSQIVFLENAAAGASVSIWGEQLASRNIESISVATPAAKLNYVVGDTFTAEGLVLKANGAQQGRVYISTNYKTSLDGYTFTANDVGVKPVVVEFNGMLCWYIVEIADHIHNVEFVPEIAPVACEKDGFEAHYACTICGEFFTDATGNKVAGAPEKISCHTPGDESNVLPGADVLCSGCGAVAGQRSMDNWVFLNLTTSTSSIGSNIKNGKVEQAEVNGVPGTKFYIGAGTVGATDYSAFYLKMSDNDANRQTVIPNRGTNTPAGQNRKVILYYENYGDEAITMNLQNDARGGNGKITIPAHGTAISTFEIKNTGGSNWFHFYVDYNATKDTSFGVYGYFYLYDGETNAPSINKSANKTAYKVGETFSSEGLVLNALIPSSVNKTVYAQSGYTTNYDGRTFTADDIGTHTVTVTLAGKTVTYQITVEGEPKFDCANGIHDFVQTANESAFVRMEGSNAIYTAKCSLCDATTEMAANKVAFVPHNRGLDGGHIIEYVTLENGQIAAKLTFNSDVAAGWKTTIEASGTIGGTNVLFPVPTEGRRLYMEMTSSADIKLTWQQEFYGDRDPFTFDLKAGETQGLGQFVQYTGSNTSSNLPYQEIVAESAIPAGTVVYLTGYFYEAGSITSTSINTPAKTTVFKVGDTFSAAGLILNASSSDALFANVTICNPTTNLDGYVFTDADVGKVIEVLAYNGTVSYYITVIK